MSAPEPYLEGRQPRSLLALHWLAGIPLFVAAFVALPRHLNLGAISGLGALTIAEVSLLTAGLLVCAYYPIRLLKRVLLYGCFLAWAGLSLIWASPTLQGAQNAMIYLLFGLAVVFSGTLTVRHASRMENLIERGVRWIDWITLTLVLRDMVVNGLPNDPEEGWLVGPRPFALLGLVMLSWHLSRWYYGSRHSRLPIALWLVAILASMSRTGMAVALFLITVVVLFQLRFRFSRAALNLPVLLLITSMMVGLVVYSTAFNDRFFAGHHTQKVAVAGLQINTSGRKNMWTATIESAWASPVIGQGLGSSQQVIESLFPALSHPHNDYLRVWHDLGIVGVVLLVAGWGYWLWLLFRSWLESERRKEAPAHLQLTAMLVLLGLALAMVTDNTLVYSFVMGPAGVLVGSGLASAR